MNPPRESSRMGSNASAMASHRPGSAAAARAVSTRQGKRVSTLRQQHNAATRYDRRGAVSPTESLSSVNTSATAGTKRKERDYEGDGVGVGSEETNINVVVRCRGRNEREVRENSAVVVSTEGVKGDTVQLSMGPSALSNKTYHFDRVFSQAADQSMIFDDVVKPILDEMLAGYNCTIFAYGQTGTGKTYTMSGDMAESMGILSDAAGIIPRVLQCLFKKLDIEDTESCVRCSFIELYNEELRDLLSPDEGAKLKIFDDTTRKGHATTVVQGMEERHITTAAEGIKRLQEGSVRRQVAATKCNDLSSRSHTVFTITAHIKRTGENGEDYLSAGKLNLVDLAGSENIQRSGAENKRAAEAGLINKSLLTLGRVINALVDHTSHVPYRESKLTRLLQDSLGGRTKTCIIATISPAKSNLEETISTLDYAFRAKNIRNKPQVNQLINKKTLLREFTAEIEKLKSELIATRQRNGVYLSNEAYEEMTVQNESRRILAEEQAAKIETMENNLRNKVQELFDLTSSFMGLKKEHEGTKAQLEDTKELLDQTELVLAATRKTLAEETHIRRAHQQTEEKLSALGGELITTLRRTVGDVGGLHAKNKRKSDLQSVNRGTWAASQAQVADVTELVEGRVRDLRASQEEHIAGISQRVASFVRDELAELEAARELIDENLSVFAKSKEELLKEQSGSKEAMDGVLDEIKTIRDHIKGRVGESLQAIALAAERIAEDVLSELDTFHNQLHTSYSSLGKDFKSMFEELLAQVSSQQEESDALRRQVEEAGLAAVHSSAVTSAQLRRVVEEEREQAAAERQQLLAQIGGLISAQSQLQEERLRAKADIICVGLAETGETLEGKITDYARGMDEWAEDGERLVQDVTRSRDALKARLKDDWTAANGHSTSIQATTKSVHAETVRVVDEQMKDLDVKMQDLDEFVARAREHNAEHLAAQGEAVARLASTVEASFSDISTRFGDASARVGELEAEVEQSAETLREGLGPAEEALCAPLSELREEIASTTLREYVPTGDTPEKVQYRYPTELPRTEAHEVLVAGLDTDAALVATPTPSKGGMGVFSDGDTSERARSPSRPPSSSLSSLSSSQLGFGLDHHYHTRNHRHSAAPTSSAAARRGSHSAALFSMSLREVNPNLTTGSIVFEPPSTSGSSTGGHTMASLQELQESDDGSATKGGGGGGGNNNTMPVSFRRSARLPQKARARNALAAMEAGVAAGGRENVPPAALGLGVGMGVGMGGRRKSPRLN